MKVGTDGVLLGSWVNVPNRGPALDIGCGSGLITLMIAQRMPDAVVHGVEIDASAAAQAQANAARSKWVDRVTIHHQKIQDFTPAKQFELIVCNPPFFDKQLRAPDAARSVARHADTLSAEELISWSCEHLTNEGSLGVIIPAESFSTWEEIAGINDLFVNRHMAVHGKAGKPAIRSLVQFSRTPAECPLSSMNIHEQNGRSEDYRRLTTDFYLAH